jgi:hypothetical protein
MMVLQANVRIAQPAKTAKVTKGDKTPATRITASTARNTKAVLVGRMLRQLSLSGTRVSARVASWGARKDWMDRMSRAWPQMAT